MIYRMWLRKANSYIPSQRLWHPERSVLSPGHELRHEAPRTFEITTRHGKKLRAGIAVCVSTTEYFLFSTLTD